MDLKQKNRKAFDSCVGKMQAVFYFCYENMLEISKKNELYEDMTVKKQDMQSNFRKLDFSFGIYLSVGAQSPKVEKSVFLCSVNLKRISHRCFASVVDRD